MRSEQKLTWGVLAVALAVAVAACTPQPKSELTASLDPGEQACVDRTAQATSVDVARIQVAKTTSTTEGGSVYVATAGGVSYMCVFGPDQKISTFEQQK